MTVAIFITGGRRKMEMGKMIGIELVRAVVHTSVRTGVG
jgi:hypothetical protein